MSADRDRETRLAEAREEIARWLFEFDNGVDWSLITEDQRDRYRAHAERLAALRAAGEGDRLRRDLAALADELEANAEQVRPKPRPPVSPGVLQRFVPEPPGLSLGTYAANLEYFADRIRDLLDGGEGGR